MKRMKCGTTWGVMAGLLLVVFAAPAMAQSSLGPNFTWDTPGDFEGWQGNPGTPVTARAASLPSGASLDFTNVPGIVINHIPASEERYIGCPSIARLPDGTYIATHSEFGPKSQKLISGITHVFCSSDRGYTWTELSQIEGAFWSTLFFHRSFLYLVGTTKQYGDLVIRRSDDGGQTWTSPVDTTSGVLAQGKYHCAPVPVIEYKGRLWRGMEDAKGPGDWPQMFSPFMMSAPVDADLLRAENWTFSNTLGRDPAWLEGTFSGWLEGNAAVTPEGGIINILRVDSTSKTEKAAVVHITPDGKLATFEPQRDFIDFPGGAKKFTIRHDPKTNCYWSLSNYVPQQHVGPYTALTRNTLALINSPDLRNWTVRCIVAYHSDTEKHAFQYVDWLFEDDDLIAVCRTAYDDGMGGAHNMHDANFLTFHRIGNFRRLMMKDSVVGAPE